MKEFELKYGCNPQQKPARIFMEQGELPLKVLNGRPGYINFLDALNGWQLVSELRRVLRLPAAASFKHVSPAGAALGIALDEPLQKSCFVDDIEGLNESPLACAYARARGTDRMSSFGDWIALSDTCDATTAAIIKREVSDGVIAPDYTPEALELLKSKRNGAYNVIAIDPDYQPPAIERKQVFGVTFEQGRNDIVIDEATLDNIVTANKQLPPAARRDLLLALITLKYTQSNSVCFTAGGQTTGVGAGQQSRIHCTRLAGSKADLFQLRLQPQVQQLPFLPQLGRADRNNAIDIYLSEWADEVLGEAHWRDYFVSRPEPFSAAAKRACLDKVSGVSLGSDAFFPFADNIERARLSGVSYIAEPGGSIRDDLVIACADKYAMVMCFNGLRLFHH
ncbi:MAG: phosphoribosylaminoimidazolecarboxamide formyltransferase [Bacillota bacterium]|nr:phosphoribosylaminoimidazolecarboxamide formyltransferase [Bacillota bacterium]